MKLQVLTIVLLSSLLNLPPVVAAEQVAEKIKEKVPEEVVETVIEPVLILSAFRPWLVAIHYSYLDFVLPGKYGIKVSRRDTSTSMWELEYTHGSFTPFFISDIGKFTEDRISLVRRNGANGVAGFQWFYGAFYQNFKLEIGSALLNRLNGTYPSADLISISSLGAMIGVGYGWLIKEKFLIGIDAITYSQPLIQVGRDTRFLDVVSDATDRDKVEAGVKIMQYLPRLSVAKIVFGYGF